MSRPKLTHLTQGAFILNNRTGHIEIIGHADVPTLMATPEFTKACLNLPKLVQAAEILHDMTESDPEGMVHKFVKRLLNDMAV